MSAQLSVADQSEMLQLAENEEHSVQDEPANADIELTPTPARRASALREFASSTPHSDSGNCSLQLEKYAPSGPGPPVCCAAANSCSLHSIHSIPAACDDSGNCSSSSALSDCSAAGLDVELHGSCSRYQHLLGEKERALFVALQDVRQLRSELQRLGQSEQWYKQELRAQKSTRLEALERLYTQERHYMQENQRLQRECVRLYGKCGEMEQELATQQAKAMQRLANEQQMPQQLTTEHSDAFEIEQQQALIEDQQQLVAVLRKQKRALLEELKRLTVEKDEKLLQLQQTLAGMQLENTRITSKCKTLLTERQDLQQTLQRTKESLASAGEEQQRLQRQMQTLTEECAAQQQLLARREHEILDLQQQFKLKLRAETDVDEVHRMSVTYHAEINAKTAEITSLKCTLLQLQEELQSLAALQAQNEQHERELDQLQFTLTARQFELEQLRQTADEKSLQIVELQQQLESSHSEQQVAASQLRDTHKRLKCVEQELMTLHAQYANMCALCERTRFELEMREIEQGKLRFEADSDKRETEQLRTKLREYLQQTTTLSSRIVTVEKELDEAVLEKRELQELLRQAERNLKEQQAKLSERQQLGEEKAQLSEEEQLLEEENKNQSEEKGGEKQHISEEKQRLEEAKAHLSEEKQPLGEEKPQLGKKEQQLRAESDNEEALMSLKREDHIFKDMNTDFIDWRDTEETENLKGKNGEIRESEIELDDDENEFKVYKAATLIEELLYRQSNDRKDEERGSIEGSSIESIELFLESAKRGNNNELIQQNNDLKHKLEKVGKQATTSENSAEELAEKSQQSSENPSLPLQMPVDHLCLQQLNASLAEQRDLVADLKAENTKLRAHLQATAEVSSSQSKASTLQVDTELAELNEENDKLLTQLNAQKNLMKEKQTLLVELENIINQGSMETEDIVKQPSTPKLLPKNVRQRIKVADQQQAQDREQLRKLLLEQTQACEELQRKLLSSSEHMQTLRAELLKTDAKLYKMQRAQRQAEQQASVEVMEEQAATLLQLQQEQQVHYSELEALRGSKSELERELQAAQRREGELSARLAQVEHVEASDACGEQAAALWLFVQRHEKLMALLRQQQERGELRNEFAMSEENFVDRLREQFESGLMEQVDGGVTEQPKEKLTEQTKENLADQPKEKLMEQLEGKLMKQLEGELMEQLEGKLMEQSNQLQEQRWDAVVTNERQNKLPVLNSAETAAGNSSEKLLIDVVEQQIVDTVSAESLTTEQAKASEENDTINPLDIATASRTKSDNEAITIHSNSSPQFPLSNDSSTLSFVVSDSLCSPAPSEELVQLRAQVLSLQAQLHNCQTAAASKSEQRIQLIQTLLAQQSAREQQLHNAQVEWEELLGALNATQKLEEHTRHELAEKRAELEELNVLFAEQNEQLRQLQVYMLQAARVGGESAEPKGQRETGESFINGQQLAESISESEEQVAGKAKVEQAKSKSVAKAGDKLKKTKAAASAEIRELSVKACKEQRELISAVAQAARSAPESELTESKAVSVEESATVAELQRKNERLQLDLDAVYAHEVAASRRQLRQLQMQVDKLHAERDTQAARMGDMEAELCELRQSRRQAIVLPELLWPQVEQGNKIEQQYQYTEDLCDSNSWQESGCESEPTASVSADDDRLRILTKVIEAEYGRKMQRYDLHIRTLLTNVRGLRRARKQAEQKAVKLGEQQREMRAELQQLQDSRLQLDELRLKYADSQDTVKTLTQQLQLERQKFEVTDLVKSAASNTCLEQAHEVANLMDDYKKLIQQSVLTTRRPKTSSILELIQRSNECVPNLHKLESSVADLRADVQQFLAQHSVSQSDCNANALKVPSLLDELRAATEHF